MKIANILAMSAVLIMMIFTVMSCSSDSDDTSGDGGTDSVLTLSSTLAVPGQFVTFTHDSFKVDTPVTITWSDGGDYTVQASGYPMVNKELRVPVPPYFSLESDTFTEGEVSIAISGISKTISLRIRKPIEIIYEGADKPGTLTIEWMKGNVVAFQNIISNLQSFDSNISVVEASYLAEIDIWEAAIAEFESTGTFTQYAADDTAYTLSEQDLRTADALLYSTVIGILEVSEELSLPSNSVMLTKASGLSKAGGLFASSEVSSSDAKPKLEEIRNKLQSVEGLFRTGAKVLLATIGLGVGLVVLTAATAASAAASSAALGLTGITCMVYVGVIGVHSELTAFLTHQVNIADGTIDDYQFGEKFYDVTVDAGKDLAFGIAAFTVGTVGTVAGIVKEGWTVVKSEFWSYCSSTEESPTNAPSLSSTTMADKEEFCSELEVIILQINLFDFSINIPGYTGPFNKELIGFALAEVDDGPPTYPAVVAISTAISTDYDPMNDDFLVLMFDIGLSEGNYAVDDSWITGGGYAELTFFSHEVLTDTGAGYTPIGFSQTGGTVELEHYGTTYGDRLKGNFSMTVEGTKTTCHDPACDDYTNETITGTISGTFDGFIKEYDTTSSSASRLASSLRKK